MTFDEMRACMEEARKKAAEEQAKKNNSSGNPITHGIGGLFGKKRKKDDDTQREDKSAPAGTPGSLMDMVTDVTSVSTSAVDANLFKIPDGYKQVNPRNVQ